MDIKLKPMIISIVVSSIKGDGGISKRKLKVEGDAKIGLAVHQSTRLGTNLLMKDMWVITHIRSGRSILRGMRSKESAIAYMKKVLEVCEDWTFMFEEFRESESRSAISEYMKRLQEEVYVRP